MTPSDEPVEGRRAAIVLKEAIRLVDASAARCTPAVARNFRRLREQLTDLLITELERP